MYQSLLDLFATNLQPHGLCLLWNPALLWLFMLSDGLIALAYYSIPISLFLFFKKRKDLSFGWLFMMFGAFILACGTTHFMSIVTLWMPLYWMEAGFKAFAGIISMVTAVVLWPQVPKLVSLPSPKQLEEINAKLARANSEFEKINVELQHRIKEQEKVEHELALKVAELTEAREIAERANRSKSIFLSSMSHELRTPLNAILGFSQILRRDEELNERQRIQIETMYKSGDHLLDMINDVLDISKIESGKMELIPEDFSICALADDIRDMLELRAREKGLTLRVDCPSDLPPAVYADAKRLRQVLINLLGNAVKFTEKGNVGLSITHVRTHLNDKNKQVSAIRFDIRDTGRGIPPDQLTSIFEPFRQVTGVYSEGSGLGLAISQRIVKIMGGKIHVASALNSGSHFWFEVEFEIPENAVIKAQQTLVVTSIKGGKKIKVLVVDDITTNRNVIRAMLEPIGFICAEANNGKAALHIIKDFQPDIVLMDLLMPELNGIEALHSIRQESSTGTLPVIALTASGTDSTREELLQGGFNEYLRKPFKEEELFSAIAQQTGIEYTFKGQEISGHYTPQQSELQEVVNVIRSLPEISSHALADAIEFQEFHTIRHIIAGIKNSDTKTLAALHFLDEAARNSRFKTIVNIWDALQQANKNREE